MHSDEPISEFTGLEIAVIGMSGRFPGAPTIEAFWQNISDGVESISFFSDQEMLDAGVDPALLQAPNYVKAAATLADIDMFDAAFFNMSPREAAITDPQQRLFLECAWEALESAGYNPYRYDGAIGVYAGVGMSTYLSSHPQFNQQFTGTADDYQTMIGNQKDFLATRVAYKLNLRGPSFSVQTACSTALVAVHLAAQGLLSGDTDIALAGGSSIRVPHQAGYLYQSGGVTSPDGHCRAFDAQAQGTAIGSGVGVVVLKRLEDALTDGDSIIAVIKGSAINNDGAQKVGYMAPSPEGQARVIRAAQRMAEVEPDTISYIETHGTGTSLGDPIEISALTQAFRTRTQARGFCAIGSVKTNIGHLDAAAGAAGLIKTILALKHQHIPPSLNFEHPNPAIDFANSPFYVNTALTEWKAQPTPRRAGVSAFGIGGTNAHIILEEAVFEADRSASRPWQLLLLSARTATALDRATAHLSTHFRHHPETNLADAAYTLQVGRHGFNYRRAVVCRTIDDAATVLETNDPQRTYTAVQPGQTAAVVFMFPGGGAQYIDMGRDLYQSEPLFREQVDRCIELLKPHVDIDLNAVLFPPPEQAEACAQQLRHSTLGLPLLFAVEYALAQLWKSWGIQPQAMIGHSLGEYVAACLSGVLRLEDALALVVLRGRLFDQLPAGAMLSVPLAEPELLPLLGDQLSVAALNGPTQSVVSGPVAAIEQLSVLLAERSVPTRRLQIDVAAHSSMLSAILEPFANFIATLQLHPPTIPYISNVTGDWISADDATDPQYWVKHLRQTVRFSAGVQRLIDTAYRLFLEVGPGRTLSTLVKQHPTAADGVVALASLRHPADHQPDTAFILTSLGRLWLAGVEVIWSSFYANERRQRIPLPTYPFERRRHWISTPQSAAAYADAASTPQEERRAEHIPNLRLASGVGAAAPEHTVLPTTYVAPQGGIEQLLAGIWQQVLGVAQVGLHDNFFELGGDSLQAVQVIAKVREHFPVDLSPHSLLQSPTVIGMAQLISTLSGPSARVDRGQHPSLVAIQPQGDKSPLFMIHPIGGGVYMYRDLVRMLGPRQPVYGLQARGFDAKSEPLASVAAMATLYIEALRTVQPGGPYLLGGSSFGGVVAFEMAQQLQAAGEEVALLALIDSATPDQLPNQFVDEHDVLAFALGTDIVALPEAVRQSNPEAQLTDYLEQSRAAGIIPAHFELAEFRQFIRMVRAHLSAMRSYVPQPYSGSIVFFRAAIRDRLNPAGPERGWRALATAGFDLYEVPGNHITMNYAPHVQVIAEQLINYLAPINAAAV